jgi:hypothetical protein
MQIVKFLQNKMGKGSDPDAPAGGEMFIEIEGKPFTKAQLIEAKRVTLDKLARERDPDKIDQLAYYVASIDSAIDAFEPIAKAKAAAARRRHELQQEDMAALAAGQKEFSEQCSVIAAKIVERGGNVLGPFGGDFENDNFRRDAQHLYNQLFASLSFDQAEKQFNEICVARLEKRSWQELVPLPAYSYKIKVPSMAA